MEESNENSQTDKVRTDRVDSRESLISPNQDGVILKVADLDVKPLCRICYSGSSKERLIRPCKCKGTIEYVHRHCLERWLEAKNIEACELCQHQFETRRTRKGCWDMLKAPEMQSERRNLIGDCTCFAFLTPLGIATFWLCAEGAIYYQRIKNSTLETVALVTLAVFLVVAYFTWIVLCTRYHFIMLTQWRNRSWNIRIVDRPPSEDDFNSSSDTQVTIPSNTTQEPTCIIEQPAIRYLQVAKETEPQVAIIGMTESEKAPPVNRSM